MIIEVTYPFADLDDDFELRRWFPTTDFQHGRFVDKKDPSRWAAVHRSTKRPDKWQVTWFDADGAIGDTERTELTDALRELPPSLWNHCDEERI